MSRTTLLGLALSGLVGLAVFALWPKPQRSPEDEIRALVARAVSAAERRDPSAVVEDLADGFHGPAGSSRSEVKQLVAGQLLRARSVVVLNPLLDVTVADPGHGRFRGTFLVGRDGEAPEASRYEIEAELERSADGWRIVTARWDR